METYYHGPSLETIGTTTTSQLLRQWKPTTTGHLLRQVLVDVVETFLRHIAPSRASVVYSELSCDRDQVSINLLDKTISSANFEIDMACNANIATNSRGDVVHYSLARR